MSQVKIYGHSEPLRRRQSQISAVIQQCLVSALGLPVDKCFQRFFALEATDFIHPSDRTENYTILEIIMFTGRSTEAKKALIRELFAAFQGIGTEPQDLEITILESPREHWGIRGFPGDELTLNYKVES